MNAIKNTIRFVNRFAYLFITFSIGIIFVVALMFFFKDLTADHTMLIESGKQTLSQVFVMLGFGYMVFYPSRAIINAIRK